MRSYLIILAAFMLPQSFSIPSWDFWGEFFALLTVSAAVAGVLNSIYLSIRIQRLQSRKSKESI